ncbi:hypothetical protein MMC10_006108 [Thelotrema lepadinum]|nr:hypothetical protein [Thelotrema lepadinum]
MSSSSSKRKRDVIPERIKRLAIRRKTPATLPHNPNPSTSGPGIGTSTSTTGTRPADEANLQRSRNLWTTALQSLHPDERTIFDQVGVGAAEPDIISHLLSAAKAKEEECATHQWKFKLFGREIILRDLVAKVVEYIEKFQSIGDAIVNFDPVHCALPWAAVKLLLQVSLTRLLLGLLVGSDKL